RQAAIAIQDGFLAAHLSQPVAGARGRPALHIYDTGLRGAREAYLAARDDGAEFIVGPLLKPELEAIMDTAGSAPTLALNTLENGRSAANLYRFALAPEDEASQVARHAVTNGASNAVALIPRNDWGDRLLGSFRTELEALGGRLLQIRTYDPAGQDFSSAITTVLNIDRSDRRRQRLGADLGIPLEFESRRRQDIDAIFVAADAGAGRLLAPQLRFYFAGDIPTYATSAIYESSRQNADLNGLLFADTPWALEAGAAPPTLAATLRRYWPQRTSAQWTRFYGFGFDAFRLMFALHENPNTLSPFAALSGVLSLDETGRVRRELPLAQFRDGVPVAIEPEAGAPPESTAKLAGAR
ncbi:MAG: penicillin-binding protein activator, partial [Rhodospirillaceae bacterium]|nr:penicillin-binding protein activator [Rhodospirillaceae bacterium]